MPPDPPPLSAVLYRDNPDEWGLLLGSLPHASIARVDVHELSRWYALIQSSRIIADLTQSSQSYPPDAAQALPEASSHCLVSMSQSHTVQQGAQMTVSCLLTRHETSSMQRISSKYFGLIPQQFLSIPMRKHRSSSWELPCLFTLMLSLMCFPIMIISFPSCITTTFR